MMNKKDVHVSKTSSTLSQKSSVSSRNILVSLMNEMNLSSKLKDEILFFADTKKTLPYIPKQATSSNFEKETASCNKTQKLPERPLQRLKHKILASGSYEREQYRPNPSKTRPPKEKERLQNLMAFGKDIEESQTQTCDKDQKSTLNIKSTEIFDEILGELKERKEFLDQMSQLGLAKKYLPEIQFQISQRLRELEEIDQDRAYEAYLEYGHQCMASK